MHQFLIGYKGTQRPRPFEANTSGTPSPVNAAQPCDIFFPQDFAAKSGHGRKHIENMTSVGFESLVSMYRPTKLFLAADPSRATIFVALAHYNPIHVNQCGSRPCNIF